MSLCAVDVDHLIYASAAVDGKIYWCLDCFGPVKKRKRGRNFAHFYHLKASPACRLYSKALDHLVAQKELARLFPPGELQIERPFLKIARVADVCWEKEKIIFEIQCSSMTEKEASMRMRDYFSIGYVVVWLLDDRRYNKKNLKPAEAFLRTQNAYFLSFKRMEVYDQFEVLIEERRVRKGKALLLDLFKVRKAPKIEFEERRTPQQILRLQCTRIFYGDRLSLVLRFPDRMLREKAIEEEALRKKGRAWLEWLKTHLLLPYLKWLEGVIRSR